VVAATAPGARRSLVGKVIARCRGAARGRHPSAIAAFAVKAREHVVTVAALASADFGAFQVHIPHLGLAPGWTVVCASLLALDFAIGG
jgi:hypothetical protein